MNEGGTKQVKLMDAKGFTINIANNPFLRFAICCFLILLYSVSPDFFIRNMLAFSIVLILIQMLDFIWSLGLYIKPLDLMAMLATIAYLLSPALSYYLVETGWYEGYNFMSTPADRYFSVAFPGTLALIGGLNFPFKSVTVEHKARIEEIENHLKNKVDVGIKLFWAGCICSLLTPFMPAGLAHFVVLGSHLIYIGGLYIWFSNYEKRMPYFIAMFLVPVVKSLKYGMFGEMLFWSIFLIMMLLVKNPIRFYIKLAIMAFGLVFILFIQSVKYEYRLRTWHAAGELTIQNRMDIFKDMVRVRANNPEMLYDITVLSSVLDRSNQGSLTSMAIRYTPEYEPFARGETIFLATAASFIPRFIWPNKPTVDGHENMRRFTGFQPFESTAMDIGQLGDAYVNFNIWGGALFLLFYGMFYSFVNAKLFEISGSWSPPALLWIPFFFVGCIQVESSVLSTFNHLIKVSMFFVITYWGFKKFLDTEL